MDMTRRKTIGLIGGGVIFAATASVAGFALTRTPHAALEPWQKAGRYDDPRLNALSWAILAPNPHNRQPWLAELVNDDGLRIYRDPARNLPETDPFNRQLTIGMGCFLELLVMAAAEQGFEIGLELFPEGENGPVAAATFVANAAMRPDPLFAYAAQRRSCKEAFTAQRISPEQEDELSAFTAIVTEPKKVEALRGLTWDAWLTEANTYRTMKESVDLMRFGRAEIEANPDGIDLGGPILEGMMLLGMLSREGQLDPSSQGFQQGVAIYSDMLAATQAYAVIVSDTNTRQEQIDAGRKWLRLNLKTTAMGLALHPVSQCLQEFPEMSSHYQSAHRLLAGPNQTVQMLGRLGYGPASPQTPRWPLETRLRNAQPGQ